MAERRSRKRRAAGRAGVEEEILTPQQCAARTGVGYRLILSEIRTGRLRAKRAGTRYLIRESWLEAWIDGDDDVDGQVDDVAAAPAAVTPAPVPRFAGRRRQAGTLSTGSIAALRAIEDGLR